MGKGLDWAKRKTGQGMAEWIRKSSTVGGGGCLCVCVVRVDDLAIAADPLLAPRDVELLLADRAPELHALLESQRKEALAKLDQRNEKTRMVG
ncbi:hypothetical protein GOB94_13950 [Granulicella sp. 5B5]|uniref:hypothetical protein n=1 Tax=Granulicella sp. 5B5 TaxID=1617967 RepID=UPI0015F72C79|nr:hypothetical protein [Granulicella sp. 5B5]QMV19669.1 hypothetical protein GOB94_13950 [Granulicella sp. 5B5]